MKIVADENMPLVAELCGPFGDVVTAPGRAIDRALVADADVLLVRSVTRVGGALLAGSRVRFVGSATIGTDHLDLSWLAAQGITWANAPGCNAVAVADYVVAALCACDPDWLGKTVAIVGCGNVGAGLYRRLRNLGVDCLCYDPFLTPGGELPLVAFDRVLDADILCLHTPLTRDGPHPTWHLFDADLLGRLKPGALVLNAGRGEVVDNAALLAQLENNRLRAVLDVWEGEPRICRDLLARVAIGTPHIAGYSLEGRLRGTLRVHEALCRFLGAGRGMGLDEALALLPPGSGDTGHALRVPPGAGFADWVLAAYDPRVDCRRMRQALAADPDTGAAFDALRKGYPWRRELGYFAPPEGTDAALCRLLESAGFASP